MTTQQSVLLTSLLLLAGCAMSQSTGPMAQTPDTPGWTGRTIVVGNNSTVAGDAAATDNQQKWALGRKR
jgi:uncharacterized lipoprotein YajG